MTGRAGGGSRRLRAAVAAWVAAGLGGGSSAGCHASGSPPQPAAPELRDGVLAPFGSDAPPRVRAQVERALRDGTALRCPVLPEGVDACRIALLSPAAISALRVESGVLTPNRRGYAQQEHSPGSPRLPDDPDFNKQWGLSSRGQTFDLGDEHFNTNPGVDTDAVAAWAIADQGPSSEVVVGVLDSGIEAGHPDLAGVCRNPLERADGVDNDGNGLVDDLRGWDFVERRALAPRVPRGGELRAHGTQIAGIIGARRGDCRGIAGIARHVRLVDLRVMSADGTVSEFDAICGVCYAIDLARRLRRASPPSSLAAINLSWGAGRVPFQRLDPVLRAAAGVTVPVLVAGNCSECGHDIDGELGFFPASSRIPGALVTTGFGTPGGWSPHTNYGAGTVHVAAPAAGIFSTSLGPPGDPPYDKAMGTSMAAAYVTGLAALVAARFPGASPADVRRRILESVEPDAGLDDCHDRPCVCSGGRINLCRALAASPDDGPCRRFQRPLNRCRY